MPTTLQGSSPDYIRFLESLRQDIYSTGGIVEYVTGSSPEEPPEIIWNSDEIMAGIQKELDLFSNKKTMGPNRVFNFKFKCSGCGNVKNKSQMAEIKDQKYKQWCKSCAVKNGYLECTKCGGYTGKRSCPCTKKKNEDPYIETYNYRPDWKEFKNKNDAYLFGIEIEVELEGTDINKTKKLHNKDWIIYKWDGSLSGRGEGGFEIVTMPLGWEWIKEHKEDFNVIFDLAKLGIKSKLTNTCGMHVHINKDIFTTFHLYKFYNFHYKNPKLLHYMSGRTWDNMKQWAKLNMSDKQAKRDAKYKDCSERHSAVNLKNPESVEVRIFRGTLAPEPFWRNIEWVKAVCDYTRYAHVNDLDKPELFRDYVRENSKEFPHLYEYLSDKVKGEILCAS
jgi:hypothetical protein